MAEKQVKIVIGANFGDEGKGLMTDYFCQKAAVSKKRCLVICHNGGSQRGHTVVRNEGIRHVFHHFGSGSFSGADTYLSQDFIVNPMVFCREWEALEKNGCRPQVWIHPLCRITTPFDMIINQLAEEKRSDLRHGSCGMGIFETICRYKDRENRGTGTKDTTGRTENNTEKKEPFLGLQELLKEGKDYLCRIRDEYFPKRLESLGIVMDEEWKSIVYQEGLILHYLEDLAFMEQRIKMAEVSLFDSYDTLVFEGGQGLLLDQDNQEYFPHLTPSSTGLKNPARLLAQWAAPASVEVCYVTRPYLTRHGAGRLDLECNKEEINADMTDQTNVPNPYQGTLRYGKMQVHHLKERVVRDFEQYKGRDWQCSLAVTHRNEVEGFFAVESDADSQEIFRVFDKVYFSGEERADGVSSEPASSGPIPSETRSRSVPNVADARLEKTSPSADVL